MSLDPTDAARLACPETRRGLRVVPLAEAERRIADGRPLAWRATGRPAALGPTPSVLLREDGRCAYPLSGDVAVLLRPEMLFDPRQRREFDLSDPRHAEAYEEMEHYNAVARRQAAELRATGRTDSAGLQSVFRIRDGAAGDFPEPALSWLDAIYDCAAQRDAYAHLGPVRGQRVLQIGGSGIHAMKLLLAGASRACLLTPMLGEAEQARAAAELAGVAARLACVLGVAEELPFADASFDVVASMGCIHHTRIDVSMPEIARVLAPGGRFAATEPWRAPLYGVGTRLLGKREPEVYCKPLTAARVRPFLEAFALARVVHHGTLSRYALLGLRRLGLELGLGAAWRIYRLDDALCSLVPGLRALGSSVALLGAKATETGAVRRTVDSAAPAMHV